MKPALTAEEWTVAIPTYRGMNLMTSVGAITKMRGTPWADHWTPAKHMAAAISLFEQPFGFTRADVKMLRDLIADDEALPGMGDPEDVWLYGTRNEMISLADRIEALLPPESSEVAMDSVMRSAEK